MKQEVSEWPTKWHAWAWNFANGWLVVLGVAVVVRRLNTFPWGLVELLVLAAAAIPISLLVWLGKARKQTAESLSGSDPTRSGGLHGTSVGVESEGLQHSRATSEHASSPSARLVLVSAWPRWWQTALWWGGIFTVSLSVTTVLARLIATDVGFDAWNLGVCALALACALFLVWAGRNRIAESRRTPRQ